MAYVRQDIFSAGEVDEINFNETDSPIYLKSLSSALNTLINDTGKITKRTGFELFYELNDAALPFPITTNARLFSFILDTGAPALIILENLWYTVFNIETKTAITFAATPYTTSDLQYIKVINAADSMIILNPNHPAQRLTSISPYNIVPIVYAVQPAYDFNDIPYNPVSVTLGGGATATFVLTFASALGFTAAWIGGAVVGGGNNAEDPIGYGIITGATTNIITGTVKIDMKDGTYFGSDFSIRAPVFSKPGGNPTNGTFLQNRLWLSGVKIIANTVFGSRINSLDNFDVATGKDADAIIYGIGSSDDSKIIHMNNGKQIEIYTTNHEYVVPQPSGIAVTPSTFYITKQSSYGISEACPAVTYENDSYYVGKGGKNLFRFQFQGLGEAYNSQNVSIAAKHLIKIPTAQSIIQSNSFSQENYLFLLNNDNTITVYQFNDISGINAFMPIDIAADANIVLIDMVSADNFIYLIAQVDISNEFIILKFDTTVYHDIYTTINMSTTGFITGLNIYDTRTVSVILNGQDLGEYLVVLGNINVNYTGPAVSVTVGLNYDVVISPFSFFIGNDSSDSLKRASYIYVDYFNSINFSVNGKLVPYQTFEEIQNNIPLTPKTGRFKLGVTTGWNLDERVIITQSSPTPLTILSISYQVDGELI